jgi:hypothetical protein
MHQAIGCSEHTRYKTPQDTGSDGEGERNHHNLLAHIVVGRVEQLNKHRDCTLLDAHVGVLRCARRNVGERPSGLKLQCRALPLGEELDKAGDNAPVDHVLDGRIALCWRRERERERVWR